MTTKELIREKIDAFYAEYKAKFHQNGDSYHLGIIDGLDIAERILDTLPEEPVTDCHDLEEAAEEYATTHLHNNEFPTADSAFKAGAEWGAEHLRDTTEKVSEDLEEAAEAYSRQVSRGHNYRDLTCGFIAGAEWMKTKMMEGAVECVVCAGMEGDKWIMTYIGSYESMLKTCKAGDKVKIIIVKED